jgi:hypothetical protein
LKSDIQANNNKFYEIVEENGQYIARWGRVGQTGRSMRLGSKYEANMKVIEKVNGGYQRIELLSPAVVTVTNANTPEERLIDYVYRASGQNIKTFMASGVIDALSPAQIEKGRVALRQLAMAATLMGKASAIDNYFAVIPTDRGVKRKSISEIVAEFDVAAEEIRLDQLEAEVATKVIRQTGTLEIPNLTLKHMIDPDPVLKILYGQQKNRRDGKRMFTSPLSVYEVKIAPEREAFLKNPVTNPKYMFHGTSAANLLHILRTGLKKPNHMANGWRLGPAIYFAEDPLRSYQYAGEYEGKDFLFLCEVKLGKSYDEPGEHSYTSPPTGYQSVRGTKSWSGIDEWTVYDPSQQTIRAILEFRR